MTRDQSGGGTWAERWDRLYDALSAEARGHHLVARSTPGGTTPPTRGGRLPQPGGDPDTLAVQLRHHHLPVLAEAGYVDWDREAFFVERGPNFAEPAFVVDTLLQARAEMPASLTDDCRVFREMECEG